MLGLGWTEMLVIGVAALIFIGPKDLPVVMKRLGQLTGQIRRMGNEFQREINKTTGLDEVRNLRNAITTPLKQTTDQIRRDFNAMSPNGEVKPSGLMKPADPKAESVVAEIHAAAGMTPPPPVLQEATKPKRVRASKIPANAKAAPTAPVTSAPLPPVDAVATEAAPVPAKKPAAKPAASGAIAKPKPRAAAKAAAVPVMTPKPKVAARPKAAPVVTAEIVPVTPAPKKRAAKTPAPAAKAGTE